MITERSSSAYNSFCIFIGNNKYSPYVNIITERENTSNTKEFPSPPAKPAGMEEECKYLMKKLPKGISGGNYVLYKGERIYSNRDIPEYREIAQEIQRITTSPLTIAAREQQFQEQYEKIFALLNSSDVQEHSPNGLIRPTKKYMITRFTPENYTFPGFSDKFMYHTTYVIVPYYEAEIEVQEGENTFFIEYQKFVPDVGILTD